jgi:hypothetical protein
MRHTPPSNKKSLLKGRKSTIYIDPIRETKRGRRHYLEKELEREQLAVALLEEDAEDAALSHLLENDDAEHGGTERQDQQQRVRSLLAIVAAPCTTHQASS